VYRIYRELELNLRIKPRKRLKRDKPDALADAPTGPTPGISARRLLALAYLRRLKCVRMSWANACGCSIAAKWPP
jgi:hypothetical protein